MEDIYHTLTENQRDFIVEQLGETVTIKQYVRQLLIGAYLKSK